jgi:hypothetical protein
VDATKRPALARFSLSATPRRFLREAARDLVWTLLVLCLPALAVFGAYRPASEAEIRRCVAELQALIEQERGQPYLRLPAVELLDDAAFADAVGRAAQDSAELRLRARNAALLQALRLYPPELGDATLARALAASASLGHYAPAEHKIRIRGRALTPRVRVTLAHELEHAFWGPRLQRREQGDASQASRESANATQPLREGSAVLLEQRVRAALPAWQRGWERLERAWHAWRGSRDEAAALVPDYERQSIAAVYPLGVAFAQAILEDGGNAALEQAQRRGIASSELLLNPQRYVVGETPLRVPAPPADGPIDDEDSLGAYDLGSLLSIAGVAPALVQRAVSGWGGDHYVLWRKDGRACVRVALAGDTPQDGDEIADALRQLAQLRPDLLVTNIGGLPAFTSCQAERSAR